MNRVELLTLLRNIAYGSECIAVVTGLFFLFTHKINGVLKWFPVYLMYIFLNDYIGFKTRHFFPNSYNLILYNISNTISIIFLLFIFYRYTTKKTNKRLIFSFIILYSIAFVIGGFYVNYLIELQSIPFIIGGFLLMITIFLYYAELLKTEQTIEITKELLFWIGAGVLIYHIGITPFRIIRKYYAIQSHSLVLILIPITLTIIMNICFTIGFIISRKSTVNL